MSSPPVFSVFPIHRQIFYTSALSRGIVNLKPLVPGRELLSSGLLRVNQRAAG